jgi:excisionase family DNA binding protein
VKLDTAEDLARLLDVPASWVYAQARKGAIPAVRLGRYVRFDRADVLRWLEEQKTDNTNVRGADD